MLRTCLLVALVTIIYTIRSTNAANCTSTYFTQDINATLLAASSLTPADYANSTRDQLIDQFYKLFCEPIVFFEYNITQTNDSVSFAFTIIYGCNETTTTVSPDGTTKVTETNSKCNQTKAVEAVTCG
jgi:hypothetical protein